MALTTRAQLASAVADWLNRTDLTTAITADFIPLCEAEMKRLLRRSTESTTIYVSAGNMDGPADLAEIISLTLDSGSPSQDKPLKVCTPQMLAEVRAQNNGQTGRPTHVAFYDEQLQFAPEPDQSYDANLVYFQQLTALSADGSYNTILTEAPDAYLYGTILQALSYLEHAERIPEIREKFLAAIDQLNMVRERESYAGGITESRLPTVFG